MSKLATTLQVFFTDRLVQQRQASSHTIAAYRDTMKLLLAFAYQRSGTPPYKLELVDLDSVLIGRFLDYLESERGNSVRTRNARLAAIHSLFRFASLRHPEHADLIARVLDIPTKRCDRSLVSFLTDAEVDALLESPDRTTWTGRRDHALLLLAIQTGLRVSELTRLSCGDVHLGTGAHVCCHGKGRKERATPLISAVVTVLRSWMTERAGAPHDSLFPTRHGTCLSRDAVERRIAKYSESAARTCTTLRTKKITAHVLRHTTAMRLLHAGVDTSVIALWLGHETIATTQIYLHADLALKEKALAITTPLNSKPGRYRPSDTILAFLEGL